MHTSEKAFAKDIAAAIHWHRPEDEKRDGHENRHCPGNDSALLEVFLFFLVQDHLGGDGLPPDGLDVNVQFRGDVAVVALVDGRHGEPIVLLLAKNEREYRHKDQGTE